MSENGTGRVPLGDCVGLYGHTSEATAFVVDDYPYGYTLRCKIRYWIERTKHGERFCSQTTNPKKPGEHWNKPKKGTYNAVLVLYQEPETGHVKHAGVHAMAEPEKIKAFRDNFGPALDGWQLKMCETLLRWRAQASKRYSYEEQTLDLDEAGELVETDRRTVVVES